ncbi:hypothetical protein CAPTEDRAFT_63864, partial [Capitella teleta]
MVDVVLVFEETRVKCHRLVLAASCEYFRRMFQTDMQERDAPEIPMKDVSSTTGLLLVEYIYSGNIEMSAENAQEFMAVSDRLLLTKLKKNVEEFLCEHVEATNCVSLKNFARLYGLESLLEVTHRFLTNHWKKLIDMQSKIDELTEDDLITLLTTYGSDEDSLLLLQKWVRSSHGRFDRFMDLLQSIERTLFSKEFIVTSSSDGFIVSGGLANKTPKRECYAYVTHTRQWRTLPPMSDGRYYHSSICDQDEFIVIGGSIIEKYHFDSVQCLNLKTLEWGQFPDLPQARCLSNLLHVQNQLFVVGGYLTKTTTARDIYKFDSTEREWQTGSPLPEKCGSAGAVSFDNKIFVVGG